MFRAQFLEQKHFQYKLAKGLSRFEIGENCQRKAGRKIIKRRKHAMSAAPASGRSQFFKSTMQHARSVIRSAVCESNVSPVCLPIRPTDCHVGGFYQSYKSSGNYVDTSGRFINSNNWEHAYISIRAVLSVNPILELKTVFMS
jgi:hypothetical protein